MRAVFKIKDTTTGLYSTGGSHPKWTKLGKSWNTRGQVICSLKNWCDGDYKTGKRPAPESWVVEEFRLTVTSTTSAKDLVT
jgi:hypothetical protein